MDMQVRVATGDDAAAVARAHVRGWQVAYAGVVPADHLAALDVGTYTGVWRKNLTEATLDNGTPSPLNLVAEIDTDENGLQVVGFACVGIWRDAPAAELGELWAMYVHPDHWGAGAGYALMNATLETFRADALTTAYLWVLEENPRARHFYERQGWVENDATKEEPIGDATIIERRYSLDLR